MFSVIYGVLINPFIYKDAGRIIVPTYSEPDSDNRRPSLYYTSADFMELQANCKGLSARHTDYHRHSSHRRTRTRQRKYSWRVR